MVDSGMNYRIPSYLDKWILIMVGSMIIGFLVIQIGFSQTVTAQSLEALDMHCREVYHSYCFGDEWQSIVSAMGNDTMNEHKSMVTTKQIHPHDLDEDQAIICLRNTAEGSPEAGQIACKVINDLDLFAEYPDYRQKMAEEFGPNFDNDTFSPEDIMKHPEISSTGDPQ